MTIVLILVALALFLSVAMVFAWAIARRPGKSGWTDTIWSYAIGVGGVFAALTAGGSPVSRRFLVAALVAGWSFRLGTHILLRTLRGLDDPRYAELRREWGDQWSSRLFRFLQVQAAAAFVLLIAILAAARNPAPAWSWSDLVGAGLLVVATAGESIADRQLRGFAADPANSGKVNEEGLWGRSRHPNYFFEWLGWWAYPIIAVGPAARFGWGWAALVGPALMYWLLVHASGIPPTEAHMLRSRGEKFRSYQRRVNAFFPGPQRRLNGPPLTP